MGMLEATAYLLPFHLKNKIGQADAGHLSRLVEEDRNKIFAHEHYFTDFDVKSFVNSIDTVEVEQNFLRGFIESTHFGLSGDKITFSLSQKMRMPFRDFILRIFHEKVSTAGTNEFRMTWELFVHLVHMTIYKDSNLYQKYNEAICRHFNVPRFLAEARRVAENSRCQKLHVGAILVVNGEIKVKGWNFHCVKTRRDNICLRMNVPHGTDQSVGYCLHAEQSVLLRSNPTQIKKSIIFVTHTPCSICTRLLMQAQPKLIVFERGNYPMDGPELCWNLGGPARMYGV